MEGGQPALGTSLDWLLIAVAAMILLALLVVLVVRLATQRLLEERERLRQSELAHQKELLSTTLEAQERERQRIAADLHDGLSTRLNLLRLSLVQSSLSGTEESQLLQLLDESIHLSRDVSHELYPPLLAQLGLVDTLREFVDPLNRQYEVQFHRWPGHQQVPLAPLAALHLFRLVQELTANTIKHAQATRIQIDLRLRPTSVVLRYRDNGRGFDARLPGKGLGLRNIESRVQALRGQYRLRSASGQGVQALIVVPQLPEDD